MALNDVVYNKTVDVAQSMPVPVVFAKQNDNAKRKVVVTLVKNGQPFVLGTGVNGYIQGATAPNPVTKRQVKFKRDLTAIDTTQGTATFIITESMTAEIGITQCEVSIYDTEKPQEILCTANINIEVQGTGMSLNDEMASDDYQAIVSIKAEVTAMRDEVRTKTNQAIAAQAAAETAAQNAYNSALGVQKIVAGNEAYTKQEADLKYSVAPRKAQTSTTGELKLTDADYGLSYLELQGNSEQYTNMASANLFDAEYNKSLGLDATDKYLRTTGEIDISVGWSYSYYIKVVPNTLYSFVGIPASPAASFVFYTKDKTYISGISTKDAVIDLVRAVTTPNNCEWMRISYGYNNQTAMYLGQPPSQGVMGAVETPSPDYPSEVKSVGDIPKDVNGVEIRNLLDEEALKNPDNWSIQGDSVYYVKLSPSTAKLLGTAYKMLDVRPDWKSSLYLSETTLGGVNGRIILINNSGVAGTGSYTFPSIDPIYLVGYNRNNDVMTKAQFIDEIFRCYKFMVTEASEIDEYRPYIGENNGLVKLEAAGKNLFNINQAFHKHNRTMTYVVSGNKIRITGDWYVSCTINVDKNSEYTLSLNANKRADLGQRVVVHGEELDVLLGAVSVKPSMEMRFNSGDNRVLNIVLYSGNGSVGVIEYSNIQIEKGTTKTEYEPYHHQITWIPLREPLRGIRGADTNFYADKIDKDGYVTQNIYFEQGKDMATFSTDVTGINAKDSLYKYAYWTMGSDVVAFRGTKNVLCNILKRGDYDTNSMTISNTGVIIFNLLNTLTGLANTETDRATIIKAIKAWVNTINPLVYYVLEKPITYKIPAVYIETYDQETNVRCLNKVKPSDMTLDYKLAISSLIKRLEALESAAVNNGGK